MAEPAAAAGMTDQKKTVLVGFMGAGKTTAARELDPMALDTDQLIEEDQGCTVAEIFEREGEDFFRQVEQQTVLETLAASSGAVISLGGGAVTSARVREALADHRVIWIDVAEDVAWQRVHGAQTVRPLAVDRESFAALHGERSKLYAEVADAVVSAPAFGSVSRLARCLPTLDRLPPGTRLLWAVSGSGEYPVYAGPGLVGDAGFGVATGTRSGQTEAPWPLPGRGFLITDSNVAELLDRTGEDELQHRIPAGEEGKNLTTVERALSAMAAAGLTRADHVVAVGGGVVGDLAGLCAALYQRGIPVVQVPTTVVAQVDSAYGGKTGVDLDLGKNYAGAYHQPSAVIVDTAMIESLPAAELAAGYVEVIKTGLLAGGRLWQAARDLEPGSAEALAHHPFLIFDCARFKCSVVAADERDGGLRQILNLGHTVGHAIESATGYSAYRHGEAVGLGLLVALRLSGAVELREEVSGLLEAWRLPVSISGVELSPERVFEFTRRDKKRLGDDVPFVLLDDPGSPRYGQVVGDAQLRAAIEELFE